ncbi:TonB-dependent receptor [Capnocytophaga canis]|uniref:TonB-dependent receptor n=1 Tax=Capnocytophaga canis TaxID=1848903 RepID=UPI0037CF43E6
MSKQFLSVFIFFISIFITYSQTQFGNLSGFVFDESTKKPLPATEVYFREFQKGVISDSKGFFRIEKIPHGTHTLIVSYLGYETQTIKISIEGDKTINVSLKPEVESLSEVVVKAQKNEERILRNSAMTVSVINSKQFEGTTSSLNDVLNKTVGVTIRNTGGVGSASRISVRGLEGKRIGVFLDDSPIGLFSDYVSLYDVPIDLIERVEIYKGIVPARLGGSAMGGAVNMITKEYPPLYYDVSYEIASFNTHKIQMMGKSNLKDAGIEFGASANYTYSDNDYEMDLPHHRGLRVKRDHDRHRKMLIGGGFKATKWWFDEISIEAVTIQTDQQIQGIETNIKHAFSKTNMFAFINGFEKDNFLIAGLDFDMDTAISSAEFNLNDTSMMRYNWDGMSYPSSGEIGLYASDSYRKNFALNNRLNLNYIISENQNINFNSQLNHIKNSPFDPVKEQIIGYRTDFDNKMISWVAGISYDLSSRNKKWLNSLTGKYYHYKSDAKQAGLLGLGGVKDINISEGNWGINNAIRYNFTDNFMIKSSVAHDVRLPSDNELLGDGFLTAPASNLLPERGTNANIGLLFHKNTLTDKRLEIELTGFYSYLTNMIRYTGGLLQSFYENFGEMRSFGVEFDAKADIFPSLYGYVNLTYQDLRDMRDYEPNSSIPNVTKGKRMPNIPYFLNNMGLEYHKENLFGGQNQNTRLMLDSSFIEGYWYDFEVSKHQERRVPRSLTFNFGIEHGFRNGKILLSFRMNNLTNEKVISEFNRPLPGRNFGLKLRYRM